MSTATPNSEIKSKRKPSRKKDDNILLFLKPYQNTIIIGVLLLLAFCLFFPRLYDIGILKDKVILDAMPINYTNIIIKFVIIMAVVVIIPLAFSDNKDNFHFELTPEKHCVGGPYMYSSDPKRQEFCSKFTKSDMDRYDCGPGFHGAPIWREGAGNQPPESNVNWNNSRCNNISDTYNDPQVL